MQTKSQSNDQSPQGLQPPRLKKPARITEQVWPEGAVPVVSICCLTFNHEKFIRDAIEGFLMQETTFPLEILITDDCSTDNNAAIIREYEQRYPQLFAVVYNQVNQYSRGGRPGHATRARARGEFIALCEGDDFWTEATKLQTQMEFLEGNKDAAGCFHDALLVNKYGSVLCESYFSSEQTVFTQRDVLSTLLSQEPTCSLMYRATAASNLPAWYLRRPSDLYLDILLTRDGRKLHFLRENMAAYRQHSGGIWSGTTKATQVVELIIRLEMLLLDDDFKRNYEKEIRSKISELTSLLLTKLDEKTELENAYRVIKQQTEQLSSAQSGKQASVQQSFIVRLLKRLAESLR